jgi:hypothetical protein
MKKSYFLIVFACFLIGCKSVYIPKEFKENMIPAKPNYNEEKNWAVLPSTYSIELAAFSYQERDT